MATPSEGGRTMPAPDPKSQQSDEIRAEYLRPKEAADFLSISAKQLENWRRAGKGGPQFSKKGRRLILYRVSDLRAWLAESVVTSTAQGHALAKGGGQ